MLRKVAKTESDEGEYGITEHIDWMAADEIEHLTATRKTILQTAMAQAGKLKARIAELQGALRKIYLWDEAGGGCTECSAGSLAKQALGGDDE